MPDIHDDHAENPGRCNGCKWWQHDATGSGGHNDVGLCLQPELAHFELQVSGDSGCNRFTPAEVTAGHGAGR